MHIRDLGEFPLIDRIRQFLPPTGANVIVGIGDDVAVLAGQGDTYILAKVDSQVENVHFLRHRISPQQLGRRSLAINLSDIAASGGYPEYALVSLALPADTEVTWVDNLYQGLAQEATPYGVAIVGGNMARSPHDIYVDVFVLGRVPSRHLLLRSGARVGDRVLVTGSLGDAAAGLVLLLEDEERKEKGQDQSVATVVRDLSAEDQEWLMSRLYTPTPRLRESAVIAPTGLATAMIDLSDGLSSDIGHICERSGVGVRLWAGRLPISRATREVARSMGKNSWDLALDGGEDYELCFTAPPEAAEYLIATVYRETGTSVSIVGEILPATQGRRLVLEEGHEAPLDARGWEHFGRRKHSGFKEG
ncbi:MAG: thiamine-phosphate kinase [Chloroflexi bacterium]|nr:thiamine-phosphate kinase [Chloroflexota bacterium]